MVLWTTSQILMYLTCDCVSGPQVWIRQGCYAGVPTRKIDPLL
jgi:hypothetical protein